MKNWPQKFWARCDMIVHATPWPSLWEETIRSILADMSSDSLEPLYGTFKKPWVFPPCSSPNGLHGVACYTVVCNNIQIYLSNCSQRCLAIWSSFRLLTFCWRLWYHSCMVTVQSRAWLEFFFSEYSSTETPAQGLVMCTYSGAMKASTVIYSPLC